MSSTCMCARAGERAGHRVSETAGNPHWPGRSDPCQTGGNGAKLGTAQKQGWCCHLSSLLRPLLLLPFRVWKMGEGKQRGGGSWEWGVWPAGYLLEGGHKSEGCVTCWLPATCQDHKGEGCDPLAQATCQRGVIRVRVWPAGYRLPVREDLKGEGCDPLATGYLSEGVIKVRVWPAGYLLPVRGVIRVRGVTRWLQAIFQRGS